MSSSTNRGYLVIGDISGYTSYVAKTELEHSQEVLAELLSLIVEHFRPVLTILRLEGDAVFANAPQGQIPRGETLVELLESTYTAFRDHIRGIVHRTTCECNACRPSPCSISNSSSIMAITCYEMSLASANWWVRRSTDFSA